MINYQKQWALNQCYYTQRNKQLRIISKTPKLEVRGNSFKVFLLNFWI